jgi:hypothetical protein
MPENLSTICCQKDNMLAPSDRSASHAAQGRRYLNQVWALRRSADSFDKPGAFDGAAQHLVPTIFHEPWWLEIASDGCYREATVERGGVLVGRLPYLVSRRAFGLTTVGTPLLTHVLGPALAANFSDRNAAHPMKQVSIIHDLIAQLPKAAHISIPVARRVLQHIVIRCRWLCQQRQFHRGGSAQLARGDVAADA